MGRIRSGITDLIDKSTVLVLGQINRAIGMGTGVVVIWAEISGVTEILTATRLICSPTPSDEDKTE